MPQFDGPGREMEHSQYVAVAASQTTQQISRSTDGIVGRDYVHRVIVNPASSAVGAWTLFDGTTAVAAGAALAGGDSKPYWVEVGVTCTTTKGFNVTTGSSVSVTVVGRFGG